MAGEEPAGNEQPEREFRRQRGSARGKRWKTRSTAARFHSLGQMGEIEFKSDLKNIKQYESEDSDKIVQRAFRGARNENT